MTISIMILCHYGECHVLFIDMLNVVMLSVVRLNVVRLSVVGLNVVMLSVVAPCQAFLPNPILMAFQRFHSHPSVYGATTLRATTLW